MLSDSPLILTAFMSCIFCKIINKEVPAEIIYEDENTLAMLDAHPIAQGHTLILPKQHVLDILELNKEEVEPVFQTVRKMTGLLKEKLAPDGFTVGINHDRVSGQMVDHLHIHVIPRFEGDGGSSLQCVVDNPPKESLGEIRNKLV